ncbi:thermonuclease family protein [Rhizobium leguminosarum]|uniref:thermonuclease family protein n=1 Tax=Rhizobium leguminosarum TaxID=384 RepID=UPI003F9D68A8
MKSRNKPLGWMALAITGFIGVCSPASAAGALRVIDGDTIVLNEVTIRLNGIDAPEAGQTCASAQGGDWPCGKTAIAAMERMVTSGNVVCDNRGTEIYGRQLGVCRVGDREINAEMVASGNAWAFRKYSTDYIAVEDKAHAAHLGIWQAATMPAWEYRAETWHLAEQLAPKGCPIKGNISENGHIYHAPWSPWYERTKVDLKKGERWFCDEAEALQAGWRAPQWGH